jgi:hypothetical protein
VVGARPELCPMPGFGIGNLNSFTTVIVHNMNKCNFIKL